jgi:hypothetical protein
MRFLLPLTLALAACSSDPAPPVDSGTVDSGGPVDVPPLDLGTPDTGASVDLGTPDAGFDAGFEAATQEIPGPDVVDAGTVDVGTDRPADDDAGACGRCVGPHVVRAGCLVSDARPPRCLVDSCDQFFADCNASIADGCEVDGRTDRLNCGGCAHQCAAGQVCMSGICTAPDASVGDRVNCAAFGSVACSTSAQCQSMCLPPPNGAERWCCTGSECGPSNNACARP